MKLKLFTPVLLLSLTVFGVNAADPVQAQTETVKAHKVKSKSARNEALVVKFYTKAFIKRDDIQEVSERFLKEDYIQHNVFVGTGRDNFIPFARNFLEANPDLKFEIKHVITDGDLVILYHHMYTPDSGNPGQMVMDMFRVEGRKIAEHWTVQQQIPDSIPHDNGVF
ncbi:ester cyclase [Thalassomonas haliotis]|uniref:Ester cyclase n=1 Tax=Thalassomonas haliotis TaxID=485448 RepID=A0ABY7VGE1_9GAMM|nr:nuclear transport factor 2 family protein [Thalassomonas haliotis]WDE11993.1 ester cyclase [Thalassomonas haliotis]